jgi:hypothetical protein
MHYVMYMYGSYVNFGLRRQLVKCHVIINRKGSKTYNLFHKLALCNFFS